MLRLTAQTLHREIPWQQLPAWYQHRLTAEAHALHLVVRIVHSHLGPCHTQLLSHRGGVLHCVDRVTETKMLDLRRPLCNPHRPNHPHLLRQVLRMLDSHSHDESHHLSMFFMANPLLAKRSLDPAYSPLVEDISLPRCSNKASSWPKILFGASKWQQLRQRLVQDS